MADLTEVCNALRDLVGAALYPTPPSGEDPSPVAGLPVRVYSGWPSPTKLDDAIKAGKAHVSIYPAPTERNTTRYSRDWEELAHVATTYTLTAAGHVITVGGAAPAIYTPQNLAVFLNGAAYTVQATAGQTPTDLAAAIVLAIADDITATATGPTITLPTDVRIGALRVGASGTVGRELRRQERQFWVSIWAPSPAARTAVSKVADQALTIPAFLTMPDGYAARLNYHGAREEDLDQKAGIYRRTLIYSVEYATTEIDEAAEIVVITENYEDQFGNPIVSIVQ